MHHSTLFVDGSASPSPVTISPALADVRRLTDAALLDRLRQLVRRSAELTAAVLVHLGEVEVRGLHLREGYGSLFAYCTGALGLSESAAYKRIQVARLGHRLPAVLDAVARGRVHLSGACVLAPHLDEANCAEVLAAASGRSKRDLEALAAGLRPARAAPLASEPAPGQATLELFAARAVEPEASAGATAAAPAAVGIPAPRSMAPPPSSGGLNRPRGAPLPAGPERRVSFVASPHFVDRFERARTLLGHALPGADTAAVLERALDVLVATLEKQRFGVGARTHRPRSAPLPATSGVESAAEAAPARAGPVPAPDAPPPSASAQEPVAERPSEHDASPPRGASKGRRPIPRSVRRAVYLRDGGRCTFVGPGGHRCGATMRLELHHRTPHGLGGPDSVDNVTLHCRPHNDLLAKRDFGEELVAGRIAARRRR